MRSIYWFRNDLRLSDNPLLKRAVTESDSLLPVFIFDRQWFLPTQFAEITQFGLIKTDFWLRTVHSLKEDLQSNDSDIFIEIGNPIDILSDLIRRYSIDRVYVQSLPGSYKRSHIEQLSKLGVDIQQLWQHTLIGEADVPFSEDTFPLVFTDFRKKIEKNWLIRSEIARIHRFPDLVDVDIPNVPSMSDFGMAPLQLVSTMVEEGEVGARHRLEQWMWKGDFLREYKEIRNGMLGTDYSSRFSPWLATGSISPVQIYYAVKQYERDRVKNSSTYWMIFELLWRDFFHFSMHVYGNRYFQLGGLLQLQKSSFFDEKLFAAWSKGQTGIPLVDANMRELNTTGFMSNRGRQIVASFLVNNLKIDWRFGAAFFENRLLDYDVASNWGNWAYLAGVGNDPRQRYFNILTQAKKYDENGEYVRHWVEEVRGLKGFSAHQPWDENEGVNSVYTQIIDLESSYPTLQ